MQLLSSLDGSIKSSKSSEDGFSIPDGGTGKKRGVRQMVREIEKTVRRLRGKAPKSAAKNTKLSQSKAMKSRFSPSQEFSKYVAFSPEVNPVLPTVKATSTDVHVRELVDRFDSPVRQSPSSVKNIPPDLATPCTSTPRLPMEHLTDLVSPQPYRAPSKHKPGRTKLSKGSVRRSQSERVGARSSTAKRPGNFRSFRITQSDLPAVNRTYRSHPELNNNENPYFPLPKSLLIVEKVSRPPDGAVELRAAPPVREIITNIEKQCIRRSSSSTSVQRSSSMPLSANSISRCAVRTSLRKAKSTPFLDSSIPQTDDRR